MQSKTPFALLAMIVLLVTACAPGAGNTVGGTEPAPGDDLGTEMVSTAVDDIDPATTGTVGTAMATSAVTGEAEAQTTGTVEDGEPAPFVIASEFVGVTLENTEGETLGSVNNLILDLESGTIAYIVISATDGRLVPVPATYLVWEVTTNTPMLAIDAETFANAPSFEGGQYPDTETVGWDTEYAAYWN